MSEPVAPGVTPPARPAEEARECGARRCHHAEGLQVVRPGDGYPRVFCRRHATAFLRAATRRRNGRRRRWSR